MKIAPTVGRIVWFFNDATQSEPLAAIVAKVWNDRIINLAVIQPDGSTTPKTSVTLVQEDEAIPTGMYATWMPYQIGQAKKAVD